MWINVSSLLVIYVKYLLSNLSIWQFVGDVQEEENSPLQPLWTLVGTSEQRKLRQEKGEEDVEAGGDFALPGPADHLHR